MSQSIAGIEPFSQDVHLAATAHELRLPLSHIKGFVSTLRRRDVEWDEATRGEFLAEIETEADRLAQMVDRLLVRGASSGTSADQERSFVSPAALVRSGVDRVRGVLADRPVRVHVPANLPMLRLNRHDMERVLANLLQNAVKYSPPASTISIWARVVADGELELAIHDEGRGVAPADRERIFDPFFRTSQHSTTPGFGLGLAICKAIVTAHGGRIGVTNAPHGGATFAIVLPVAVDEAPSVRAA